MFSVFKEFKVMVERESDCRLKSIRSDNGTEHTLYQSASIVKIWASNNNSLLATLQNRMGFLSGRTEQ